MEAAQQGDPEAFGALFDHFYGPVYRYVAARVGRPSDAEDLAQLVFVKALEALPRYVRAAYIAQEALLQGEWCEAMDGLDAAAGPSESPRTDGADVAARALVALAAGDRAALTPDVSP